MGLNTIPVQTEYAFKVASVEKTAIDASHNAVVITLEYKNPAHLSLAEQNYEFVQTEELTEAGVAVQPYGAFIINALAPTQSGAWDASPVLKTPAGLMKTESIFDDMMTIGATIAFAASDDGGGGGGDVG